MTPAPTPDLPRPPRLRSIDALRGFDMILIVGAEGVAHALEGIHRGPVVSALAVQLQHATWEGCHCFDIIFPLFLFLIGVSIVLSLGRITAPDDRRRALYRVLRRSLLLFAVGVFFYGGFSRSWPDVHLMGVLPRIALCYLAGALLQLFAPRRGIILAAMLCLAGYWALLRFVPFPDIDLSHPALGQHGSEAARLPAALVVGRAVRTIHGSFAEGRNLANYVDFRWLPGWQRNLNYSNEGLLSTIPAIASTLFGIMAGWLITDRRWNGRQKAVGLIAAGLLGVALGLLWGIEFPIIKRIWTSSFCLLTSGWSAVLLGAFYWAVEVRGWNRWCTPFLWVGANALTIYLANELLDFPAIAARLCGGDISAVFDRWIFAGLGHLVIAITALLLPVLLARFLYRKQILLRL